MRISVFTKLKDSKYDLFDILTKISLYLTTFAVALSPHPLLLALVISA